MFKNLKQVGEGNTFHIQLLSQKIETKKKEEQEVWDRIQNIEKEIYESEKNGKNARDELIKILLHEMQLIETVDIESRIENRNDEDRVKHIETINSINSKIQQIDREIVDFSVKLDSARKDRETCLEILKELGEIIPPLYQEEKNPQKQTINFWSFLLKLDSNAQSSLLFLALLVISMISVIHMAVVGIKNENLSIAGAGAGGVTILWRMKQSNDLERNKEIRDYEMLLTTFMKFLEKFDKIQILKDNSDGRTKLIGLIWV